MRQRSAREVRVHRGPLPHKYGQRHRHKGVEGTIAVAHQQPTCPAKAAYESDGSSFPISGAGDPPLTRLQLDGKLPRLRRSPANLRGELLGVSQSTAAMPRLTSQKSLMLGRLYPKRSGLRATIGILRLRDGTVGTAFEPTVFGVRIASGDAPLIQNEQRPTLTCQAAISRRSSG
jgi:hypothetical protein